MYASKGTEPPEGSMSSDLHASRWAAVLGEGVVRATTDRGAWMRRLRICAGRRAVERDVASYDAHRTGDHPRRFFGAKVVVQLAGRRCRLQTKDKTKRAKFVARLKQDAVATQVALFQGSHVNALCPGASLLGRGPPPGSARARGPPPTRGSARPSATATPPRPGSCADLQSKQIGKATDPGLLLLDFITPFHGFSRAFQGA